jgi:Xaa-Pro aminopeptidase
MKARLEALRQKLVPSECDAFFSIAPPANQYLTGFRGSASGVIVTQTAALFFCDFRYTEQAGEQVSGGYTVEEVSGSMAARLGERLKALGIKRAAFEPADITVAEFKAVQKAFSGECAPVDGLVSTLRQVKNPEEVEKIRAASALAEGVLADIAGKLKEGVTERETAAQFEYEFKRRGASKASFDTIALFGPRTSLPHGEPGDTTLQNGDPVLFDFGCLLDGYCSDLTRTYVFGTILPAWFEEAYGLVLTAQRTAIEAVQPGMCCRELDAVARTLIQDAGHGDHFGHGLGHGVGIEIHEAPRLNPTSETRLEPGMIITIEPGIYIPGRGGIRIEDIAVVTSDGCEVLSTTPTDLRVLSA